MPEETRVCSNPYCLTPFVPNVRGATKAHCARCYVYSRRHNGILPGAKSEAGPTHNVTVRVPDDFETRLARVVSSKPATWLREIAVEKLAELERKL